MSFRPYPFTDAKMERWMAQGRGRGEGADYVPWLQEGDVPPAHGHMERFVCAKSSRRAICFSSIELHARMYYEALESVVGIEEQYPLDRETTRRMARQLGIRHPCDPRSRVDIVMTTDLVVRVRDAARRVVRIPRSCKPHASLADYNDAEHAEIERIYWQEQGARWKLVTDSPSCMPRQLLENLETMKAHRFAPADQPYEGYFDRLCDDFVAAVLRNRERVTLGEFGARFQAQRGLKPGEGQALALFLIHKQRLRADIAGSPLLRQGVLDIARACTAASQSSFAKAA